MNLRNEPSGNVQNYVTENSEDFEELCLKKVFCYSSFASMVYKNEGTFDSNHCCCCSHHNEHTDCGTQVEQCSQILLERLELQLHEMESTLHKLESE